MRQESLTLTGEEAAAALNISKGLAKKAVAMMKTTLNTAVRGKIWPATWLVASMFLSPKRRDARALAPTPVPTPIAITAI